MAVRGDTSPSFEAMYSSIASPREIEESLMGDRSCKAIHSASSTALSRSVHESMRLIRGDKLPSSFLHLKSARYRDPQTDTPLTS